MVNAVRVARSRYETMGVLHREGWRRWIDTHGHEDG